MKKPKNDELSRKFGMQWVIDTFGGTAMTFDIEDGKEDVVFSTSAYDGEHLLEIKTQRRNFEECYSFSSTNVNYTNLPRRSDKHETFENHYSGIERKYTVPPTSGELPQNFFMKNFVFFNADWKNGEFMVESDKFAECKWLKVLKNHQDAMFIFKDGILYFTHPQVRKAFLGYIRYKETEWTNKTGAFKDKYNIARYSIKAALDVSMGTFYPIPDIPQEIFDKN